MGWLSRPYAEPIRAFAHIDRDTAILGHAVSEVRGRLRTILSALGALVGRESTGSLPKAETLLDHLSEGLISFDKELRFTYVNRKGAEFFGAPAQQMIGRRLTEAFPEAVGGVFLEAYVRALDENTTVTLEAASNRRPGRWLRCTARPGPDGLTVFFWDTTDERFARRALEESEERFRSTFEQAAVGIAHISLRGDWLRVNRRVQEILGYSREELLTSSFPQLIGRDHLDEVAAVSQRLVSDEVANVTSEIKCLRRDGSPVWLQATGSLTRDLEGDPKYFIVVMQDISSRKAAEVSLLESEERYRSLIESSPDMLAVHRRGEILYVNRAGAEAIGAAPPVDLVGRSILDFLDSESRNIVESMRRVRFPIAGTIHTLDNKSRAVELVSRPVVYEGEEASQLIVRDVTERKRAELALQETSRLLTALVKASPAAIYVLDEEARITLWNPAAEQLFGWQEGEVVGKPLPTISGSDTDILESQLRETLNGRAHSALELRRQRKDGSYVEISASVAPLRDLDQEVVGVVVVAVDVTERKELESQLRQAQKMEAVGRLAGGVAHDFNNILTTIQGYTEILLDQVDEPQREELEEISHAAQRASELTRQLLLFSRQEVLQPQVIDLNETIGRMDRMLRRVIGEDIRLETRLDEAASLVWMDPGHIQQLLLNLAVNARDAMPGGGHLSIVQRAHRVNTAMEGQPNRLEEGDYYVISVSDTGVGMDETTVGRIFEPFFTTKGPGKGTGLGLSTVYGIVQRSGGQIRVKSIVGAGTTFDIYLPRSDRDPEERVWDADPPADLRGNETVLLVEDEESVRDLVRRILHKHGYHVLDASDGEDALELATAYKGRIDLLLTDVVMLGMGGRELALRMSEISPHTKVLFMSGYTEDEIVRRGVQQASVSFLAKPFATYDLLRKVRETIGESSAQGSKSVREQESPRSNSSVC